MRRSIIISIISIVITSLPVIGVAQPIQNPANRNFYECRACNLNWFEARDFASQQEFLGIHGHLATITDAQEQDFFANELGCRNGWLGAMQAEGASQPDEGWEWITGEPFIFTAWSPGEPNDFAGEGSENCLIGGWSGALWNDGTCPLNNSILNCIIEYEIAELPPRPIPTISKWGLIAMAGLMGIVGFIVMRRKKVIV